MKKRIVIALGHRALGTTLPEQKKAVKTSAAVLADMVEEGYQLVITHSNAPQVGMIHMRRHGEGIGQFQIRIRAGDAEAHQETVRAVGQHRAVVHGHAGHVVR